jgi:Nucleotide modification associated domain 2
MIMYSYLIEHDLGLAPNPFGQYCTLAVCKSEIRKSKKLCIGDWIIGTGSHDLEETTKLKLRGKLIYAMQVTERISLEEYWVDERFQYKKPVMNGTLVTMFGDNFYHKDAKSNWIQEDSAHSKTNGTCNLEHLRKDTRGENVLISENFYYFGNQAPQIPKHLLNVCHTTQGQKIVAPEELATTFIDWVTTNFSKGIHGDPLNWCEYNPNQLALAL